MLETCKNKFLELNITQKLTIIIVIVGILVFFSRDIEKAAQTGDFLAGFAGALAFLWLIAGFKQQQNEIKMQKEEIKMQRKALELQALELNNANKISTYNHIQQLTIEAVNELYKSKIKITDHKELISIFLKIFSEYNEIFTNSTDKNLITKTWMEWWNIEQSLNTFISKIAFSLKLYIEYKTNTQITSKMDIYFIEKHIEEMKEVPYLEQFYGTMKGLIVPLKSFSTIFKMFKFAGTVALTIGLDSDIQQSINQSLILELKQSLDKDNVKYPPIYNIYNKEKEL